MPKNLNFKFWHWFAGHPSMRINTLQPGNVPWLASPWRRHWIWGVGAERPSSWGGTSQNSGRNDRVWGGRGSDRPGADRLRGGSTGTPTGNRTAQLSRRPVAATIAPCKRYVMSNTHRRRRRDETVESRFVGAGGVYWA